MKSAPVTVVPGSRASSRTDAELVTCQVHDSGTPAAHRAIRATPPEPDLPLPLRPHIEVTRLLQVEGEPGITASEVTGCGCSPAGHERR